MKYRIKQVPAEMADFSYYFDNDGLKPESGDFCNTLFIVPTRETRGFNADIYKDIQREAENLIDCFSDVGCWNAFSSYKEAMESIGIDYSPTKCHKLKEWAKNADVAEPEDIAKYLTITTKKPWAVESARGYSQGDYCEMVYCKEAYPEGVKNYGEVWLGAATEYSVSDLDENGEEIDTYYGFIVADCEAWRPEDVKKLICKWEGIPEEETELLTISGQKTVTEYTWAVA